MNEQSTAFVQIRDTCRCCSSTNIIKTISLRPVPIFSPNVGTEDFSASGAVQDVAPLDNYMCADCGLNQLIHVLDPKLIYRNYLYRTSISVGLPEHFAQLADSIISRLKLQSGDLVLEIGSNDGTLLKAFQQQGMETLGVDPAPIASSIANENGIETICAFFDAVLAKRLKHERGAPRAIVANNVIANIDNLDDVFLSIRELLSEDGAFVFETQYALDVLNNTLIDVIYHEHLSCFSVKPLVSAMKRFGLELFDVERHEGKGGSIRVYVQHAGGPYPVSPVVDELMNEEVEQGLYDPARHVAFQRKFEDIFGSVQDALREAKQARRLIGVYGSSVGCAALIHQFGLEREIDFIIDDNPTKKTIAGPNYEVPVYSRDWLQRQQPGLIVVLAWRYADRIIANNAKNRTAGWQFAVPLPSYRVV